MIKEMTKEYEGTIISASHDQLLKEACNKILYLRAKVEKIETL